MTTFFTRLAKVLSVNPDNQTDTGRNTPPGQGNPPKVEPSTLPRKAVKQPPPSGNHSGHGIFQPLVEAILAALEHCAQEQLAPHQTINPNFYYGVERIEITPLDEEAAGILRTFLNEQSPKAISNFLRNQVSQLPAGEYFLFDDFKGLALQPIPTAKDALKSDSDFQALRDVVEGVDEAKVQPSRYLVRLTTRPFPDGPPRPQSGEATSPPGAAPVATNVGPHAVWRLTDSKGQREVTIPLRRKAKPVVLGTKAEIEVLGTYTSSRHGQVWFEWGDWWYVDSESTNGSRVVRPNGEPPVVFPGRNARDDGESVPDATELRPGYKIIFAADQEGGPDEVPVLELPVGDSGDSVGATPVAPNRKATAA